jgi:hypothetical protein
MDIYTTEGALEIMESARNEIELLKNNIEQTAEQFGFPYISIVEYEGLELSKVRFEINDSYQVMYVSENGYKNFLDTEILGVREIKMLVTALPIFAKEFGMAIIKEVKQIDMMAEGIRVANCQIRKVKAS